jgi:stage II sporulation protein D
LYGLGVVAILLSCLPARAWTETGTVDLPASLSSAQAGPLWIRVAVVRQQQQIDLAVHGRFRIVSRMTAESLREGERLRKVAVRATPEGIVLGTDMLPQGGVRIEPARDATINLNGQRLRGALEILQQQDATLLVVNHVDLEDYLRGVLSKEAPHDWPLEALKAIGIAARTYALFQRLSKSTVEYDVTGDVLSQVYGGKTAERGKTSRAVRTTEGLILVYQNKIFPTFYHSTCGGVTEHASVMGPFNLEPLAGRIACSLCVESPFYRWRQVLTKADVAWAVKQQGRGSLWPVEDIEIATYSPTGRIAQLRIRGATRSLLLSGYEFRQLFGFERLRSTAFAIVREDDAFVLQGRGWGHGVGLCQWGARELARRGFFAHEILAFYYPNARLARLGELTLEPILIQGGP